PVAHALDLGDAGADRGAEHHEVERGRDHRRGDALHERAPGAVHLEGVDRPHAARIHRSLLTRSTTMSSSEVWLVLRSLSSRPAALSSFRSAGISLCSACVSYV